jgi:nitric oxide reductase subunit C
MSSSFTKSAARNIFYGGAVFFFLLFLAMTFDTMQTLPKRDNRENLTDSVATH